MEIIGISLCALGWIAAFTGELMILTAAFHRGKILFIACLLIPFAVYGFALAHIRKLWLPLALAVVGVMFILGGLWLCGGEHPVEALYV